jgi:hypothetical protein
MNIAYIILAHGNFNHLERLINAINDDNVRIYIHIDKKVTTDFKHSSSHVYILPEEKRVKVYWGGMSIVWATINTIKYAKANETFVPDYYILISGLDYPIRSKEFLSTLLTKNLEYITLVNMPSEHKHTDRLEYYYFEFDRRNKNITFYVLKTIEYLLRKCQLKRTKQLKFKPYGGYQWFALTKSCMDYILHQCDTDKEMMRFFNNSIMPDESLFHTIIGNSPFKNKVGGNLTFVEFPPKKSSPRNINEQDIEVFQKQTEFVDIHHVRYTPCFARKFEDSSLELVQMIDEILLKKT